MPATVSHLAVVGTGLIGASAALAARSAGVQRVAGWDPDPDALAVAASRGAVEGSDSLAAALDGAELALVAAPVAALPALVREVLAAAPAECAVTDVGSTKGSVVAAAAGDPRFVGGHPICGAETRGPEQATADLFDGATWFLTPVAATPSERFRLLHGFVGALGARPVAIDPGAHDRLVAVTSHLPHALAFTLVDMIVRRDDHRSVLDCAAGGFRDFTRIAGSDPVMWRDICLANRAALLEVARQYQAELGELLKAIESGDGEWLRATFARAKHARDALNTKS